MGEFLWLPGFRTKAILRVRVARVSAHAQRLSGGHASVQPCKRVLARVWFYPCLRVLTRVCVRARTRVRASGLKLMGGWFKAYGRVLFWHWTSARVRIYKHAEIWIYHLEAMSYMSGQWQPLNDLSETLSWGVIVWLSYFGYRRLTESWRSWRALTSSSTREIKLTREVITFKNPIVYN